MEGVRIKSVHLSDVGGCKADMEARTIEFYAAVFGVRDSVGDVVDRGAFAKTIAERQPKKLIKLGRNHMDMIGLPVLLEERDFGLFVRGKVDAKPCGDECLVECESGTLAHASFMYRIMNWRRAEAEGGEEELHLTELKLFEVGPVYFPANELATILAVRKSGRASHAALIDFALADLLAPAKAGLEALAQRDSYTNHERREISAALEDLAPFVDRLRAIEAAAGGPDPMKGTTRSSDRQGPEPKSATTPDGKTEPPLDTETLGAALDGLRRLRQKWAA